MLAQGIRPFLGAKFGWFLDGKTHRKNIGKSWEHRYNWRSIAGKILEIIAIWLDSSI